MKRKLLYFTIAAALVLSVAAVAYVKATPPGGTFPKHVGQYTLKRSPASHSPRTVHGPSPKGSWWSVYKRPMGFQYAMGTEATLDVGCDVFVFSSSNEAKQAFDAFIEGNQGWQYWSWKVIRQGKRQDRPGESFQVFERYFTDEGKAPQLKTTGTLWTNGANLIIAESSASRGPGVQEDPRMIKRIQELGLKEEPAVDFMNNYPN